MTEIQNEKQWNVENEKRSEILSKKYLQRLNQLTENVKNIERGVVNLCENLKHCLIYDRIFFLAVK